MTVFVSYSHSDIDQARRIASALAEKNVKVWRDEWKIVPGDSLTERIMGAMDRASFLCVLLSNSALASEWVRKEVEAGLLRAMQDGSLTIIPLIVGDCAVPAELEEFLRIDFRTDFDASLNRLYRVIERRYGVDGSSGAGEGSKYFFFYGTETGTIGGRAFLELEVVSVDREEQFCVLTNVEFRGNDAATEEGLRASGIASHKEYLLSHCARAFADSPGRATLTARKPAGGKFSLESADGKIRFDATFRIKLLGEHRGEALIFNFGALFQHICWKMGIAWDNAR